MHMNNQQVTAEFHCHTCYSVDSLVKVDQLIETCREKGIGRVAITDHNCIAGALQAKELAPDLVIVGEEIETTDGELIAYFLTEEIPAGLTSAEVIRRLKAQGAFISISHPFDLQRNGRWTTQKLEAIVPDLDGMEVFNSRCILSRYNDEAAAFAEHHHLAGLVGSDAHSLKELGRAVVMLPPFNTAEELRQALKSAVLSTNLSSPFIHLVSVLAKLVKKLSGIFNYS
ncbi:MAG: PHP domain-containing protein [Anaerolineaceae bacterium]